MGGALNPLGPSPPKKVRQGRKMGASGRWPAADGRFARAPRFAGLVDPLIYLTIRVGAWACGSAGERPVRIRKVGGSNPPRSTSSFIPYLVESSNSWCPPHYCSGSRVASESVSQNGH